MKKKLILLSLFSIGFSSCEKDDICAADTPTTPQLVIEFFNEVTNASLSVSKLKIIDTETSNQLGVYNEAKIKIPLKTDVDITKYSFTINSGSTIVGAENTDKLEFNYSRNNIFISRACGFKTNFILNNPSILVKESLVTSEWIKKIIITKSNILNENETHIKIFL